MSTFLEDAHGTGNKMKIDDHGRAYVLANTIPHMSHHCTYHKNAFSKLFQTTLSTSSEEPVFNITNNLPGKEYEIYWVRISSDANLDIHLFGGGVYTSGGNRLEMMNTYLGNGITSGATIYEGGASGSLVVDTTDATEFDGVFLGAYKPHDFNYEGGVVIPFGKSVAITADGTAGDKVKLQFGFAIHDEGQKL